LRYLDLRDLLKVSIHMCNYLNLHMQMHLVVSSPQGIFQQVEHLHGKQAVSSSSLLVGSTLIVLFSNV